MAVHLIDIKEIFSSADGRVQFIELAPNPAGASTENQFQGVTITVTRSGDQPNSLTFGNDLSGSTANRSILLATAEFTTLTGITPDFAIPSNFLFLTGAVTITFGSFDSVTYNGNLPTDGVNSLQRTGVTAALTQSSAATPRNFAGSTMTFPAPNVAPVVDNPIADTVVGAGQNFGLQIDAAAFWDPNGDALGYSATLENGDPLPATLAFDGDSADRQFSGMAGTPGSLSIKVTADDGNGGTVSDTFLLSVISGEVETGGTGADSLLGTAGDDLLSGAGGADTIDGGGAGSDTLSGGAGTDLLLSSISATLGSDFENLTLTGTDDIDGTGNSAANVITGNEGDNELRGLSGADTLIGGGGNDTYVIEVFFTIQTSSEVLIVEAPGGGDADLVESELSFSLPANVENLTLTGLNSADGTGNDSDNTINGNSGNNVLDGGAGNDSLNGGNGNDTYLVDSSSDDIIDTGGLDSVVSSAAAFTLLEGLERLTLTGSAVAGSGNELSNTMTGSASANELDGGFGNDSLNGAAGNDTLNGNTGTDSLKGGAGSDRFVFDDMAGSDKVLDFEVGDEVHLDNYIFESLDEGTPQLATGTDGQVNDTSEGELKYETDTGRLYYDADGSGAGAAYLIATFDACGAGAPDLSASSIVVFTGTH